MATIDVKGTSVTVISGGADDYEGILAPKPEARPRIYANSIGDLAHQVLLKVGRSIRDVKQRVAEQTGEPGGHRRDAA